MGYTFVSYLRLLKVFFGLSESGDAWHYKLKAATLKKVIITSTTGYQAQYNRRDYLTENNNDDREDIHGNRKNITDRVNYTNVGENEHRDCRGMLSTYVDDILYSGNNSFRRVSQCLDNHIQLDPGNMYHLD